MTPFDCYKTYLGLKNHFTQDSYDYFLYCKKIRASLESFHKRKDRFFFEKLTRQKPDSEIENFFVSNFVSCSDPERLWIGEIIKNGEEYYRSWQKRNQSLKYLFTQEIKNLLDNYSFDSLFDCSKGHPIVLKQHLGGNLTLETIVILERIFSFSSQFNKKLNDPVWSVIRRKIHKYSPFITINVFDYKKIMRSIVLEKS